MTVLLDTNILVRLDHVGNSKRETARQAIEMLVSQGRTLRTIPQVLYEYWVVATRASSVNGLGFSSQMASCLLGDHKELFPPLLDERGVLEHWEMLVSTYDCRGKLAHDAHRGRHGTPRHRGAPDI